MPPTVAIPSLLGQNFSLVPASSQGYVVHDVARARVHHDGMPGGRHRRRVSPRVAGKCCYGLRSGHLADSPGELPGPDPIGTGDPDLANVVNPALGIAHAL